ncbi:hypothetical protein [Gandjariella thermophila]|uniref:hypothetical protein n=1 Tax=Gandjariella thermophila TaxID=1931992 RepID=UPI0027D94085|nr:hypothetical protein [Gandjariella thermophila]
MRGINHAFLCGLLEGLRADTVDALLVPRTGGCCVALHARRSPDPSDWHRT